MKKPITILEGVLRDLSKESINNLEHWLQVDSISLSEAICLAFERYPTHVLEDIKEYEEVIEYDHEMKLYHLATSSIQSGALEGAKTESGFWVNFDDFLRWAYERGAGKECFIQELVKKRAQIIVTRREPDSSRFNNVSRKESAAVPELPPAIGQLRDKTIQARRLAVELCLQALFPNDDERSSHLNLIEKIGYLEPTVFSKCKKRPHESHLTRIHRCRAVACTIRHTNPSFTIKDLYSHDVMEKLCPSKKGKPAFRTFRRWMNEEGIRDNLRGTLPSKDVLSLT